MNDLIVIEGVKAIEVFTDGGLGPIIKKIEQEVLALVPDISSEKGRKEIASTAYRVARTKTALDEMGKGLTEDWKKKSKAVDVERGRAWDRLESLQKIVRAPLTEWENKEKERVSKLEEAIREIEAADSYTSQNWQVLSIECMQDRLNEISEDKIDWQEFQSRATAVKEKTCASIKEAIAKKQKHEAEQAELARLRQEEQERQKREHEAKIAAEAAAKAKAETEAKAKADAEALAAKVKAETEKAEQERLTIEKQKKEAEERAKKSEEDRIAAIAKAEKDRLEAEEKSKRDQELAVQRERERQEEEKRKEAEAAAKRENDNKHLAKINAEIIAEIKACGIVEESAKELLVKMAKGQIPHVKINYQHDINLRR